MGYVESHRVTVTDAELGALYAALGPLEIWHDRIQSAVYPPEIVFVLPSGMFPTLTGWHGRRVFHADVPCPMVAVPAVLP